FGDFWSRPPARDPAIAARFESEACQKWPPFVSRIKFSEIALLNTRRLAFSRGRLEQMRKTSGSLSICSIAFKTEKCSPINHSRQSVEETQNYRGGVLGSFEVRRPLAGALGAGLPTSPRCARVSRPTHTG